MVVYHRMTHAELFVMTVTLVLCLSEESEAPAVTFISKMTQINVVTLKARQTCNVNINIPLR